MRVVMKRRQYYKRTVKPHYGGELRGLAHAQLFCQGLDVIRVVTIAAATPAQHAFIDINAKADEYETT